MKVIRSCQPTYFDVDDTLIKWNPSQEEIDQHGVPFNFDYGDGKGVIVGTIVPHRAHVQQLKLHALRGHTIFVWSAGGELWAEAAVKALQLEEYVSYALAKPLWAYDDKMPNEFIARSYLEDK